MPDYTVVVNDCAAPAKPGVIAVRHQTTAYGPRNFVLKTDSLVDGLPDRLTGLQQDWIEIFGSIFAADCICMRGKEDLDWQRRIELHVPCREPSHWKQFSTQFEELFGKLTDDRLIVNFVQADKPSNPPRQRKRLFRDADCVALFSGGMDSFVDALQLQDQRRTPMLVSHTGPSAIRQAQFYLEDDLRQRGRLGDHATFVANFMGSSGSDREGSQRSRSLLFLASACLVASALEIEDIFLNENGIMAIHAPLTEARIGSYSTRTASPAILHRFLRIASEVLRSKLAISNSLSTLTKADVVESGLLLGTEHSLPHTVSCWSIGRTSQHCGRCIPCLVRRISCEYHSIVDAPYKHDCFGAEPRDDSARDNIVHLVMFVQDFVSRSDIDLELEYPELLNTGPEITYFEAMQLHRRWGQQATTVLLRHPYTAGLVGG